MRKLGPCSISSGVDMLHPPCFNCRSLRRLGCNAELIVDEFGEKLLEELDYVQVGANCRALLWRVLATGLAFASSRAGRLACLALTLSQA